ncbi:MAG: cyclase family protein [Phycisphaerae bacterium]|nr:cyclase family protein [Phycisphaerae bacterium]
MIYDISLPLSDSTPVYPGDRSVQIRRASDIDRGDAVTLSEVAMSLHAGTHVDAPCHFISGAPSVDEISLDILVGHAVLVDVPGAGAITAETLDRFDLAAGTTRLLLRTPDAAALGECGARWLVARGVKLVGIDRMSIGFSDQSGAVHRILLAAGVVIVESLNLADVPLGEYQLICLPLKLIGAEGVPVRAILLTAGSRF